LGFLVGFVRFTLFLFSQRPNTETSEETAKQENNPVQGCPDLSLATVNLPRCVVAEPLRWRPDQLDKKEGPVSGKLKV